MDKWLKSSFLLYFSILHFTVDEKELEEKNKQREAKKQKLYFGMFDLQSKTNENIFTEITMILGYSMLLEFFKFQFSR